MRGGDAVSNKIKLTMDLIDVIYINIYIYLLAVYLLIICII